MRLLADEGVDKPIVDALRNEGFDVVYILETNRGVDDAFILRLADEDKRVLLTQDKDFGELVFRMQQAHYGVVLIRLEGHPPLIKAQIVSKIFVDYTDQLKEAFTVIQPNLIRIRKR